MALSKMVCSSVLISAYSCALVIDFFGFRTSAFFRPSDFGFSAWRPFVSDAQPASLPFELNSIMSASRLSGDDTRRERRLIL
jgi:hypothetical protein